MSPFRISSHPSTLGRSKDRRNLGEPYDPRRKLTAKSYVAGNSRVLTSLNAGGKYDDIYDLRPSVISSCTEIMTALRRSKSNVTTDLTMHVGRRSPQKEASGGIGNFSLRRSLGFRAWNITGSSPILHLSTSSHLSLTSPLLSPSVLDRKRTYIARCLKANPNKHATCVKIDIRTISYPDPATTR